jgi:hypothetical protein
VPVPSPPSFPELSSVILHCPASLHARFPQIIVPVVLKSTVATKNSAPHYNYHQDSHWLYRRGAVFLVWRALSGVLRLPASHSAMALCLLSETNHERYYCRIPPAV